jgi:carboxyl-terminal processing protease
MNRYLHGEFDSEDSIHVDKADTIEYRTLREGRIVYGGGGIMPDIFIPLDTTKYSSLYVEMFRKGIISSFAIDYFDANKELLKTKYPTIEDYKTGFHITEELMQKLLDYSHKEGVKDSTAFQFSKRTELFVKEKAYELDSLYKSLEDLKNVDKFQEMFKEFITESFNESMRLRNINKANEFIKEALLFNIARNLFGFNEAYQIHLMTDEEFLKAMEVINNDKIFKKFNVDY